MAHHTLTSLLSMFIVVFAGVSCANATKVRDTSNKLTVSNCAGMLVASSDDSHTTPWARQQREAAKLLCRQRELQPFMVSWVDPRFVENYHRVYGSDGWAEDAWVNYFKAVPGASTNFLKLTEDLVESVHRFSKKPIILVNFGDSDTYFDPTRFPRLVLLQARDVSSAPGFPSFNFNKLQAVLLAKVKVGVSLDSDMIMANSMADSILARTRDEITEAYPYPMLPVHFLDRDPANLKYYTGTGNYLVYDSCPSCPKPTMRWGQAQPTWTFWSLPFLARWQAAKLSGSQYLGVDLSQVAEDEDMLNVALWAEGARKQWCMWQPGGVGFVESQLYDQMPPGEHFNADRSRYLKGTPIAYFFGHAEKDPKRVEQALRFLDKKKSEELVGEAPEKLKAYYYDDKFYSSFTELSAANPEVSQLCTL